MAVVGLRAVFVLACLVHLAVCDQGELCGDIGAGTTTHIDKHGIERCCKRIECAPGQEAHICTADDPTSTQCLDCKGGHFQPTATYSDRRELCDEKQLCRLKAGLKVKEEGDLTSDRVCECDLSQGYFYSTRYQPYHCRRKKCPAGEELHKTGKCMECLDGDFKQEEGYHLCRRRTNCQRIFLVEDVKGNNINDTTCLSPNVTVTQIKVTISGDIVDRDTFPPRQPSGNGGINKPAVASVTCVIFVCLVAIIAVSVWAYRTGRCRGTHSRLSTAEPSTEDIEKEPSTVTEVKEEKKKKKKQKAASATLR